MFWVRKMWPVGTSGLFLLILGLLQPVPRDLPEPLAPGLDAEQEPIAVAFEIIEPPERPKAAEPIEPTPDPISPEPPSRLREKRIVGEFEDSALKKVFGQQGIGLFVGPSVIDREICKQYGVRVVGRIERIREQFYAISMERKIRHPALLALTESARRDVFPTRSG